MPIIELPVPKLKINQGCFVYQVAKNYYYSFISWSEIETATFVGTQQVPLLGPLSLSFNFLYFLTNRYFSVCPGSKRVNVARRAAGESLVGRASESTASLGKLAGPDVWVAWRRNASPNTSLKNEWVKHSRSHREMKRSKFAAGSKPHRQQKNRIVCEIMCSYRKKIK